jgi:hypothetical protein
VSQPESNDPLTNYGDLAYAEKTARIARPTGPGVKNNVACMPSNRKKTHLRE